MIVGVVSSYIKRGQPSENSTSKKSHFLLTLIIHQRIQVFKVQLTFSVVKIHGYACNR